MSGTVRLFHRGRPNVDWLTGSMVALDLNRFVPIGAAAGSMSRRLETHTPGVFADRNVDGGKVKRVAAVVGKESRSSRRYFPSLSAVMKPAPPAGAMPVVDRNIVHGPSEHASANRNPAQWHAEPILPSSR